MSSEEGVNVHERTASGAIIVNKMNDGQRRAITGNMRRTTVDDGRICMSRRRRGVERGLVGW